MNSVFVLQHVHEALDSDEEDVKFIGVYRTQEKAEQAIQRLLKQPGFCESPDGFHIDEYPLDHDHWVEGYISYAEAAEGSEPKDSP